MPSSVRVCGSPWHRIQQSKTKGTVMVCKPSNSSERLDPEVQSQRYNQKTSGKVICWTDVNLIVSTSTRAVILEEFYLN